MLRAGFQSQHYRALVMQIDKTDADATQLTTRPL